MGIIKSFFGFIGRHFFNVRRWVSYDFLKGSAVNVYSSAKTVFKGPTLEKPESFDEALKRLALSETDLKNRYNSFRNTFIVFLVISIALLVYTLYLFYHGIFMGGILSLAVTALVGMHAFKYHFWMFQIKHRKLGCTLNEWTSNKINNNHQSESK
jgi:intracellular multiplication protein IcmV